MSNFGVERLFENLSTVAPHFKEAFTSATDFYDHLEDAATLIRGHAALDKFEDVLGDVVVFQVDAEGALALFDPPTNEEEEDDD